MRLFLTIILISMLHGCDIHTPNELIENIEKQGGGEDLVVEAIKEYQDGDLSSWLIVLYRYAAKKGYSEIALEGWSKYSAWQVGYTPKDFLTEELLKQNPKDAKFAAGWGYRMGYGYSRNDFLALKYFIESSLAGNKEGVDYIVGIYSEYKCDLQVAFMEKAGGKEIDARLIGSSSHYKLGLTSEEIVLAQNKAIQYAKLIESNGSIADYPFDSGCAIDVEVRKLLSKTNRIGE